MNQTHEMLADSMGVETIIQPEAALREVPLEPANQKDSLLIRAACILTLALIACLAVAGGWRKGYVLAPTDGLKLVAPWRTAGEDYRGANENLLDQTDQFVPWTIYTVERYKQGQIPLWNPNSQLGVPFLANGQSAIFYPTIFLHWFLPPEWSWTISAALRLFIAGLGVYLLAGRYGLRGVPRLLASVAFMLCGFNVVWLNHPQMNVMPLLPWAVLMTEMLIERVRLHRILGAALVFFVQFLGGHPASCIHLLLVCFLVWGLRIFWPLQTRPGSGPAKRLGSGFAILCAMALGFALAAAQWLPLIEYAQNSGAKIVRAETLKGQSLIATDPRYLIGLLFPYANGYPDGVSPFEIRQATHLPNTNELAPGFVGTIPLILALFAAFTLFRRREVRLWAIIALISAAIAIKFPGIDHLVRLIPGLNVAQNGRLLVVTALGLAILSGFGLQELTALLRQRVEPIRLRKTLKWCAISLFAIAMTGAVVLLAAKGPILNRGYAKAEASYKAGDAHEHNLDYVKNQVDRIHKELLLTCARLMIPAAMFGLVAILLWTRGPQTVEPMDGQTNGTPENGNVLSYRSAAVPKPSERRALGSASWPWIALALIDLLAFAIPYNRGAPVETYFPNDVAAVRTLYSLPRHRLAGTFRSFIPETSTAYDLPDIRGYDALAPARYYKWWKHPGIGDLPDYAQGYLNRLENPQAPAWSLLNFGYLLTAADQPAPPENQFTLIENGDENAHLYEANKIRPRAWVVSSAEVYPDIDPVLDRVAKMDFNPDETALLDKEVAYDSKELADDDPTVWTRTSLSSRTKPAVQFEPGPAKEGDRPEVITLKVTGASGGYLVLADTYFPGWTARLSVGSGVPQDVPILPANGVMRAIPLPRSAGAVTVEMRYRPWPWRIGAAVSLGAIGLFVLLVGLALIKPRSFETTGETWPK